MLPTKIILPVAALVAMLGSAHTPLIGTSTAFAQSAATAPPAAHAMPARPHHPRPEFGRYIDGRIAFLKAELKITPAQEAQWNKVAQAMRDNVRQIRSAFAQMRAAGNAPHSAVSRLEMRARLAALRAQNAEHFLAAFRPLYASLSPAQKQMADGLFAGHHRRFGRR